MSVKIRAAQIEFVDGGNTIWIHSPEGGTILRIKTRGKVIAKQCSESPISHGDIMVDEDIQICIAKRVRKRPKRETVATKLS